MKAIEDVKNGISVAAAARSNCVPRVSLLYKSKGVWPVEKKMGPCSIFTKEEEEYMVSWITNSARAGFPIQKNDLLDSAQKILKDLKRPNPFTEGRPGQSWYKSFLLRNPGLSERIPQNLTISRNLP